MVRVSRTLFVRDSGLFLRAPRPCGGSLLHRYDSGRGDGGMGVELEGGEVSVDAAFDGVEFGVGSGLDDAALVDDEDAVGVADGGEAVPSLGSACGS